MRLWGGRMNWDFILVCIEGSQQICPRFTIYGSLKSPLCSCVSNHVACFIGNADRHGMCAAFDAFQEVCWLQGCFSSQSFWKAGSERKESQSGSSLRRAGVIGAAL